jgi:hypothetical protein
MLRLSLTLFVLRVTRADDADDALPADDLAVLAQRLDAASDLHVDPRSPVIAELDSLTSVV